MPVPIAHGGRRQPPVQAVGGAGGEKRHGEQQPGAGPEHPQQLGLLGPRARPVLRSG